LDAVLLLAAVFLTGSCTLATSTVAISMYIIFVLMIHSLQAIRTNGTSIVALNINELVTGIEN
jgi:hypothetical protein